MASITLTYLRQQFDYFNTLCFEGRLTRPVLRVNNARTQLGSVRFKKRRRLFRNPIFSDFVLSISAFYDLSNEEIDDTILHEMIHLDILSNQQYDDSAHGPLFRQRMDEINRRYGRHITISHRGELKQNEQKSTQNIVALSQLSDGTWGITRVSAVHYKELAIGMPRLFNLRSIQWYNTRNPRFNLYPRSRTPKIYRIDKEEALMLLSDAIPLNPYR